MPLEEEGGILMRMLDGESCELILHEELMLVGFQKQKSFIQLFRNHWVRSLRLQPLLSEEVKVWSYFVQQLNSFIEKMCYSITKWFTRDHEVIKLTEDPIIRMSWRYILKTMNGTVVNWLSWAVHMSPLDVSVGSASLSFGCPQTWAQLKVIHDRMNLWVLCLVREECCKSSQWEFVLINQYQVYW